MEKRKGTVLIVEDDAFLRRSLVEILKPEYKIFIAQSGEDALEKLENSNRPDLILLDIMMPGMSGYEVCRHLKKDEQYPDIPVIFISALTKTSDIVKGFEVGGVDYVTKPFQPDEVKTRVKTHITLRNMQKKLADQNTRLQEEIQRRSKAEAALQKANNELEIRVKQRTAELSQANGKLEKAREKAESASLAKTRFLSKISHELKTPLTPVVGMIPLVLMDSSLKSDHRDLLQTVQNSADKLAEIIDDLIELSNMEAEGITAENQVFNLKYLIESAADSIELHALEKGLETGYEIDPEIPDEITGDPDILEKILVRLGNNAVKFTDKGSIEISVKKEKQEKTSINISFSVKDTGCGIPADKLESIFQDFTQADNSSTREKGGLGLGLTMVKRTVALLGGSLAAESIEGKGSTFYFTLEFTISG